MKKNNIFRGFYILSALFLISSYCILNADIPRTITLQGYLTDNTGQQKPDGKYNISLNLYESETGGSPIWFDLNREINVVNGIFSIILGISKTGQNLPYFNKPYWLELKIEDEPPLSPRVQLHSSPYAFYSINSDSSDYSKVALFAFTSDTSKFSSKSDSARYSINSYRAKRADSSDWSLSSKRSIRADTADYLSKIELPIGSIIAYGGKSSSIPTGWLICDGRGLNSETYPLLYTILNTIWGDGSDDEDSTTNFNIPDLRGMFLRGVSDSTDIDPDAYCRQPPKQGANCGDIVGSVQNHSCVTQFHEGSQMDQSSLFGVQGERIPWVEYSTTSYRNMGANETRPINANVYYIIKVK